MAADITFFLAPDDETAAATRNSRPDPALRSLTSHSFDPDDAVVEWAKHFEADSTWPRYVAEIRNDGIGVFVVPDSLVAALATAGPDDLRAVTARWFEYLVRVRDDDQTPDERLTTVEGVAQLAAAAEESGGGLRLYCWHY